MSEPVAKYAPIPDAPDMHKALPCPICGGENISSNEWCIDDDHAGKFGADEWGEIWAFECMDCLCAAPIVTWNNRPDPWRYLPEMPREGQRILHTYQGDNGSESSPITGVYYAETWKEHCRPIVRWMAVPEV